METQGWPVDKRLKCSPSPGPKRPGHSHWSVCQSRAEANPQRLGAVRPDHPAGGWGARSLLKAGLFGIQRIPRVSGTPGRETGWSSFVREGQRVGWRQLWLIWQVCPGEGSLFRRQATGGPGTSMEKLAWEQNQREISLCPAEPLGLRGVE